MCITVLLTCVSVHHLCVWCPWKPEEGTGCLGPDGYELPCGCRESNADPPERGASALNRCIIPPTPGNHFIKTAKDLVAKNIKWFYCWLVLIFWDRVSVQTTHQIDPQIARCLDRGSCCSLVNGLEEVCQRHSCDNMWINDLEKVEHMMQDQRIQTFLIERFISTGSV